MAETTREQTWCRFYNGAHTLRDEPDAVCEAGVTYTALVPRDPGWLVRLPCVLSNTDTVECSSFALYSPEEWVEKCAADDKAIAAHLTALFVEQTCPACQKRYDGKQVGPCVYCEHCGARLYQGSVPPAAERRGADVVQPRVGVGDEGVQ